MTKPRDGARKYVSRIVVNKAIIANLSLPEKARKTWPELAEILGVKVEVVHDQVNRLKNKGLLPTIEQNHEETAKLGETAKMPDAVSADELWEKVQRGELASPEDRRRALSFIIAAGSDQNKTPAIRELNSMDSAESRGIGPPPPSNDEETVGRLSTLMRMVGKKLSQKSMEVAFA